MGREVFKPMERIILIDLTVTGVRSGSFRTIVAALDTGAETTSIPISVALDLGYDLANAEDREIVTGSRIETVRLLRLEK